MRAVRPGRTSVVASSGEGRDSVSITVREAEPETPAVSSVSIAPRAPLQVGDTATLEAIVLDAMGARSPDADVTWQSSNLSIVEIDPRTGHIRARQTGTALVFARSGGESAIAEVSVRLPPVAAVVVKGVEPLAVGGTISLWTEVSDSAGARLLGRPVEWSSGNPRVAAVNSETGIVSGISPGAAEIIATVEGRSGRTRVTITRAPDAAPAVAVDRQAVEDAILAGVTNCYDAVRSADIDRLAALYAPETDGDRDKLKKLSSILRTHGMVRGRRREGERGASDREGRGGDGLQLSAHLEGRIRRPAQQSADAPRGVPSDRRPVADVELPDRRITQALVEVRLRARSPAQAARPRWSRCSTRPAPSRPSPRS